jgi:hypothetical protein
MGLLGCVLSGLVGVFIGATLVVFSYKPEIDDPLNKRRRRCSGGLYRLHECLAYDPGCIPGRQLIANKLLADDACQAYMIVYRFSALYYPIDEKRFREELTKPLYYNCQSSPLWTIVVPLLWSILADGEKNRQESTLERTTNRWVN